MITFERADDAAAVRWCDELNARRAGSLLAANCALLLLGWVSDHPADIDLAWRVLNGINRDSLPGLVAEMEPRLQTLVAAVIARAGLPDSARAVLTRAIAVAPADPEMLQLSAGAYLKLGDTDEAAELLQRYFEGRPARRAMFTASRRFSDLLDRIPAATSTQ
jgi:predicted Zn-dependent protease